MRLNSVVLPAPFGPMIEKTWPGSIARLTSSTARTPPKETAQVLGGQNAHARLAGSALARAGTMPARRKIMKPITIRPSTMCS